MDELVNKLLLEYASKVQTPDEQLVLKESIKYINEHLDPSKLISFLCESTKLDKKFIIKVVRAASEYKNEHVKIHNISEGIE